MLIYMLKENLGNRKSPNRKKHEADFLPILPQMQSQYLWFFPLSMNKIDISPLLKYVSIYIDK